MSFHTNVTVAAIEEKTGEIRPMTEGTIVYCNAQRFDAMRRAGLLALIDDGQGGTTYGIEMDVDIETNSGMVYCVIADCSAFD